MNLKELTISSVKNKNVLVRVDFNVPLKKTENCEYKVQSTERIEAALETIHFLAEHANKTILISHLGRPESKSDTKYSLKPVAKELEKILKKPVVFLDDCVGADIESEIDDAESGSVILLENVRYHKEENKNDKDFAKKLAKLADIFVNEAFSTTHRAHASVVAITEFLPSLAGFSLQKEVETFTRMLEKPKKPLVIILGGAKISDKVGAIEHLANIADIVLVGGAVANNFLKAEGLETYKSYLEEASSDLKKQNKNYTDFACDLINEHKNEKMLLNGYIPLPKIMYPIDMIAAKSLEEKNHEHIINVDLTTEKQKNLSNDLLFLDIGPKTIQLYQEIIKSAGTVFWNGPMGVYENPLFANGTKKIAASIALSCSQTLIGGGDTISAASHFGLEKQFSYVSAAGGAALEFLSGEMLVGIKPLLK